MPSSLSLRIRINKILSVGVPINDVCPLASLAALQKTCKAGDLFKATCLKGSFALASLAALQKMADVGKQARFDVASNDPENIPRLQVLWCLSVLLASCSGVLACSLLLALVSQRAPCSSLLSPRSMLMKVGGTCVTNVRRLRARRPSCTLCVPGLLGLTANRSHNKWFSV